MLNLVIRKETARFQEVKIHMKLTPAAVRLDFTPKRKVGDVAGNTRRTRRSGAAVRM
jgi:hypothetical protein